MNKLSPQGREVLNSAADSEEDEVIREDVENSTTHESASAYEDKETIAIANKETQQVSYTRILVMLVLLGVATAVSVVVYLFSRQVEEDNFEMNFVDKATKITSEFEDGARRRLSAVSAFGAQMTSHALSSNQTWPNVVLPDFERIAGYTIEQSDVLSIIVFPIVTKENRKSWEVFSVANQAWLVDGLLEQGMFTAEWDLESMSVLEDTWGEADDALHIPEKIFKVDGTGRADETGPGPYAPWWQFAPVFPVPTLVNYNAFSHPTRGVPLNSVLANGQPIVTQAWDYSDSKNPETVGKAAALNLFIHHSGDSDNYEAGPASDLYVPIFDSFDEDERLVVGEIGAYVYWQVYFENVLSESDVGLIVVLENTCDQMYSYGIDGAHAHYLGPGDHHEREYSNMGIETDYGSFIDYDGPSDDLPDGQCLYHLRVYPSYIFESTYITSAPLRFTMILAGTFLFTCMVFMLYDYLVERRQRLVLKTATQSTAVVASLFPKEVRDRLMEQKDQDAHGTKKHKAFTAADGKLSDNVQFQEEDSMAIADVYKHCTVQFCDIVGFTKWSSNREPKQVFRLLETLYKSFDRAAKQYGVFKVETIGDAYLAVTGLPKPQEDHALLMARFAADILLRSAKVTGRLAEPLGDDTADLTIRIGMHSGPVTGGVLRGAKARFQLFGDTVNTAARMETTGVPSKIHMSESTARLIRQAGKEDWIRQRDELVEAKGKGSLQTFWLEPHSVDISRAGSTSSGDLHHNVRGSITTSSSPHSMDLSHDDDSSDEVQLSTQGDGRRGSQSAYVPKQEQ